MDTHTSSQRSYNMSKIKRVNTEPEKIFTKMVYESGLRGYRKDYKIFGRPDLFFLKSKVAVFVDGCFWHKCKKCYKKPKSNSEYWTKKINNNIARDKIVNRTLFEKGIVVVRIWEHEIQAKNTDIIKPLKSKIENSA